MKKFLIILAIVFFNTILSISISFADLNDGLVAYYPFNGNANNEIRNENNGIVYGATLTTDRFENTNCAYSFDGTDDYIDIGDPIGYSVPSTYSVCAWVNSIVGYRSIILTKRHSSYTDWPTLMISNYQACISVDMSGYGNNLMGNNIADGQWHFICGIKDENQYKIYVDGKFNNMMQDNHNYFGSPHNMHIGHHGAWRNYFEGKIDDIRIYNRVLTEFEIKTIHSIGQGPIAKASTSLDYNNKLILDGSKSSHPDINKTIVSWHWELVDRETELNKFIFNGEKIETGIIEPACYYATLTVTDEESLTGTDKMEVCVPASAANDTIHPQGAVHAHDNMLWPPDNKMVTVKLDGHVLDELSIAGDGGGIGVSLAYLLINGTDKIILRQGTTDLLDANGHFSTEIEVKVIKGMIYTVDLYASDTRNEGQNSGIVDSTYIRIPHNMDDQKSDKSKKK